MIELIIAVAIISVLATTSVSLYTDYLKKADILMAEKDIMHIADEINDYFLEKLRLPESLQDVNLKHIKDPWGNSYEYLRIDTGSQETKKGGKGGKGALRKDKNLVPINSDYDLYSKGPDGRSVSPLTAKHSRDDIIRANNGGFIGVAQDY